MRTLSFSLLLSLASISAFAGAPGSHLYVGSGCQFTVNTDTNFVTSITYQTCKETDCGSGTTYTDSGKSSGVGGLDTIITGDATIHVVYLDANDDINTQSPAKAVASASGNTVAFACSGKLVQ